MAVLSKGMTTAQKSILNILLMQAVWLACVLGGTWWGWGALLVFFIVYQTAIGTLQKDWLCIFLIAAIGSGVDCIITEMDLLIFPEKNMLPFIPLPGWMFALWLAFASLFVHGLAWLRDRYFLAALAGTILGPSTYYAGSLLHGVKLGMIPTSFFLCYGILWAIMTPLFGNIAKSTLDE